MKAVSIADAKNQLPKLVHEAERHPVQITRRGQRVAVLVSSEAWDRLGGDSGGTFERVKAFRARHDLRTLGAADALKNARSKERPRAFRW